MLLYALMACVFSVPAGVAFGQIEHFDKAIARKQQLSPRDEQEVGQFADRQLGRLANSEDVGEIEDARRSLLEPLGESSVSVGFRIAFADATLDRLGALAEDLDSHRACNALQVVGGIVTDGSLDILKSAINDDPEGKDRRAIRIAAARGLRHSLRVFASNRDVLLNQKVVGRTGVLAALESRIAFEPDEAVLRALIGAIAGAELRTVVHSEAIEKLGSALAIRVRRLRDQGAPDDGAAWAWTLRSALETIRRPLAQERALGGNAKKEAARTAGQALAYARDRLTETEDGGGLGESSEREHLAEVVELSDRIIRLAAKRTTAGDQLRGAFDRAADTGDAQVFAREADHLIGRNGIITSRPLQIDAQEFAPVFRRP